jgi:hypothetical protein
VALRVNLNELYELSEKIKILERDVSVLADNALASANDVIERANASSHPPLNAACKKAFDSVRDAKKISGIVRGHLSRQSEMLREAAAVYERGDRIDAVNSTASRRSAGK